MTVYALWSLNGHLRFWVREALRLAVRPLPGFFAEIIDPRPSSLWTIRHDVSHGFDTRTLARHCARFSMAIREWDELWDNPWRPMSFVEAYAEGEKSAVAFFEEKATFMDHEFDDDPWLSA
ncbi:hypothetical protein [Parvularcula mediterranea]|uniref:hypothetical protein n=1 Tax=Parvularcula mediterranea TaxID=2732508 RepID=UPI001563DB0D|nr:hypothetical protein [Parvularcula mediterranea]